MSIADDAVPRLPRPHRPDRDPVREAVCVTDEEQCRWTSGERTRADDVTALIAKHAAETGHHCYRRTATDYATAEPGDFH